METLMLICLGLSTVGWVSSGGVVVHRMLNGRKPGRVTLTVLGLALLSGILLSQNLSSRKEANDINRKQ